jgi:hypothetical protein
MRRRSVLANRNHVRPRTFAPDTRI